MRINRMTPEEIAQVVVVPVGGMIELTKRVTSAAGNGIIFEITAKPETHYF